MEKQLKNLLVLIKEYIETDDPKTLIKLLKKIKDLLCSDKKLEKVQKELLEGFYSLCEKEKTTKAEEELLFAYFSAYTLLTCSSLIYEIKKSKDFKKIFMDDILPILKTLVPLVTTFIP